VVFKSRDSLRKHFDRQLAQHRLAVPRREPVAPHTLVRLQLVLPDEGGELSLAAKVVETVERPSRAKAPYLVQLELLDLDSGKEEKLGRAAGGTAPVVALRPQGVTEPVSVAGATLVPKHLGQSSDRHLGLDREADADDLDALIDALIQPWEPAWPPEPDASAPEADLPEPLPSRERLPEELARELTDFTLQLVRAVTKSSYYTADHQEAGKAKLGLYAAFTTLVADRPEVTLHARKVGEKCSILVYGIFDEPTDLARALLKGTSALYVPKLCHYFEANGLLSISFKRALTEDEFHQLVDLLASPASDGPSAANRIVQRLAENRIHNISVVVVEDRISSRGLSWRVEMALTRLKKDLSVIPLYEHLSEQDLRRVRLQVFRDVVRPLRQVKLIRELLENCDRIIEEVEEFSDGQLAEIEAQVLASVPEESLPAILEGLVDDVAEAKQESEEQMDRLLRLTRRVSLQLSPEQAKNLEVAFRALLNRQVLALEELPTFLQQKFIIERNTDSFLKFRERILSRFDGESTADKYQIYLNFFESIFPELLARADPSATIAIVEHVSAHRLSQPSFEKRPEWATAWLERIIYSSLSEKLVRELSKADKLKRESLLELCRRLGDEAVPILFRALSRCESVATRRALIQVLTELKHASRAFLRSELDERDLRADYLLELLRILSRVGRANSAQLAARFLEHADPLVRIEALGAASVLDPAYGEECAVASLSDTDPKLREVALKALFERKSAAPGLFAFCERILGGLDDSNQAIARLVCSGLAGYEQGETREQSVALLLMALGVTHEESGGWWSSLRRSVKSDPSHASVRVAACQALGRLRAQEARDALTSLGKQADPAVRRAALHALKQISGSPDASSHR
jgi:hypothetical protein